MEAKLHETLGQQEELFDSRSEYYLNFPLSVFRDKIYQEVQTAKYLHTIKERDKLQQASLVVLALMAPSIVIVDGLVLPRVIWHCLE
jgi:hypothetical protein